LLLARSIGLPGCVEGEPPPPNLALSLFELAVLNKIPLLFLESLRSLDDYPFLEAQLSRYRQSHERTLDLITLVSGLLQASGIRYTVFKTLKPFSYTPADIDVLLWSREDLTRTSQILEKEDLKTLNGDLYGLTMFSVGHSMNVDITTEVAASSFVYLSKKALIEHSTEAEIHNVKVKALHPSADLVAVAAHCLYKEQMYTLADYYTFALSLPHYERALQLAEKTRTKFALSIALKLAYDITLNAFGPDNYLMERLSSLLQTIDLSEVMRTGRSLELPVKYSSHWLLRGLLEKILEDPVSRDSLPEALQSAVQPGFFRKLMRHMKRKGY